MWKLPIYGDKMVIIYLLLFILLALVVLEKCVECEIPLLKSYDELGPIQLQQRIEGMKYVYN